MSVAPESDSAIAREIERAEEHWASVVQRKDKESADRILADEFRLTGPDLARLSTGRAATKDVWMVTLERIEVRSFALDVVRVSSFESTAVAFVHATIDWSIDGRALPSKYFLTDIWVKRDGRWQVVTRVSEIEA